MKQKIIISGHSSGLGKALASHYLDLNKEVFGLARRQLPEQENLYQYSVDLSDEVALQQILEQGKLDEFIQEADELVLINNAGTIHPSAVCGKQMPSEIAAAVNLNITAPLVLTNYILAVKSAEQHVKIIHISSGAGRKSYAGWSVYGACKAALDHHAKCVEIENHPNVKISSIAPGVIDTEMQEEIREQALEDFPILPRFMQLHANQQLSSPESIATIIMQMIAHEDFGDSVIQDVRNWQALKQAADFVGTIISDGVDAV